jgi:hypothetical protein
MLSAITHPKVVGILVILVSKNVSTKWSECLKQEVRQENAEKSHDRTTPAMIVAAVKLFMLAGLAGTSITP